MYVGWNQESQIPLTSRFQSVLVSLVFGIWFNDFMHTTPYKDLLPPNDMFFAHPLIFLQRYWEVYDMHVAYVSEQTAERRRQKVADVRKRSEYRKAHGMDGGEGMFGGWTARSDTEVMGPGLREGGGEVRAPSPETTMELAKATVENVEGKAEEATYVDFEGKKRPVKKWFGIW